MILVLMSIELGIMFYDVKCWMFVEWRIFKLE